MIDDKKKPAKVEETPARRGRGRQTKLTPAMIDGFVQVLQGTSTPIATMAEAAGIHRGTFFMWLQKGAAAKSGIYRDLFDAVTHARAEGTQATLAQMRSLGLKTQDWRELAWELERTRPKEFGLRVRVHVEEELTNLFNLLKKEFKAEPQTWERIARVIAGELSPEEEEAAVPPPTEVEKSE